MWNFQDIIFIWICMYRKIFKSVLVYLYVIPSTIYLQKYSSRRWWLLRLELVKRFDFVVQKSWFFCNSKHFSQNIMTPCYSYYFCIFFIFRSFQIIMVSLFLARHDQHFIMFKDLPIFNFQFTNFPAKTKYDNTVAITYSQGKTRKKLLKQFFD